MFHPQPRHADGLGSALDILASHRRRVVLAVVSDRETPIHREELAAAVVALERDTGPMSVPLGAVRRASIRLHHVDLPRLEAADLLSYDHGSAAVTATDLPLTGEEWLEMPVVEALESWNGAD